MSVCPSHVGGQLLAALLSLPASVWWEVTISRAVGGHGAGDGGVGMSSALPGRAGQWAASTALQRREEAR